MNTEYLTLHEIHTMGFEALLRELGPAGAIRFLQQYETGRGNYTRDRHKFLPKMSIEEIGKQIYAQHLLGKDREANFEK